MLQRKRISNMLKPSVILKRSMKLIAKPEHWCQGNIATNAHGRRVTVGSKSACAFCMLGSIERVIGETGDHRKVVRYLRRALHRHHIGSWNDEAQRTHAEVVAVFRKAIRLALKDGQ